MSITLGDSPLGEDIRRIMMTPYGYKEYFLLTVTLHTSNLDVSEEDGVYVGSFVINRDYIKRIADYMEIDLVCLQGTFVYDIYPFSEDLELTLTITKQQRHGSSSYVSTERFKATYDLSKNSSLPTKPNADREIMNRQPPITFTLQLMDKTAVALRVMTTQGVFSQHVSEQNTDMSASSLIQSIMSTETEGVTIDNNPSVDKIKVEPSENEEPMLTVTIPTGTRVMDVPGFIQNKKGGMYTGGVNSYFQRYATSPEGKVDKTIFVYSLFNGKKFDEEQSKILFYVSPAGMYNTVPTTYKYEARILRVLTNPIDGLDSTKGALLRSEGDGFRTASAEALSRKPVEITPDGPVFKKTRVMTEVIDKVQPDGINYAPHKGVSSNHFVNTTDVLARKGEYVKLVVDNLDVDFYYPGIPCQLSFEVANGLVQELYGIVHRAYVRFAPPTVNPNEEFSKSSHALCTTTEFDVYITGAGEEDQGANYF